MANKTANNILFISIDPLEYRRRLLNHIETAVDNGLQVFVIAPSGKRQSGWEKRNRYRVKRIYLRYSKGPLKFIQFNLKIFFHLLFNHYAIIQARGLWVLPALIFSGKMKKPTIIYDAHEYFVGLSIFDNRRFRKSLWMKIEKKAIPDANLLITVSEPIAQKYQQRYHELSRIEVIRNLPSLQSLSAPLDERYKFKYEMPVVLFHGYFMAHRGLENLVKAVSITENVMLLLVGKGPLEQTLRQLSLSLNISDRVQFMDFVANEQLIPFASQADIGATLLEPVSENHRYALPNKFFEYIMAGIPVLASNIPTLEQYIRRYETGKTVDASDPEKIAKGLQYMLSNKDEYEKWKQNARSAAEELNWEKEAGKLSQYYTAFKQDL